MEAKQRTKENIRSLFNQASVGCRHHTSLNTAAPEYTTTVFTPLCACAMEEYFINRESPSGGLDGAILPSSDTREREGERERAGPACFVGGLF